MLVLIVDHHAIVRTGLACFVEQLGEDVEVLQAASHEAAIEVLARRRPDLVISGMLRTNGSAAPQIRELGDAAGEAPIIVFADPASRELVEDCLKAGAKAFVPKSTEDRQLIHILRLVTDGGGYAPPEVLLLTGKARPIADKGGNTVGPSAHLTNRQLDVLNRLRLGMSNNDIADELGLNLSTVKGHVSAVLRSLGVRNRTQAVIAAPGSLG